MRERPDLWTKHERIQWGCTLMRLLGEDSLEHLHVLLSGLRSVERSAQAAPFERAVQSARVILGDLLTKNAVQNAVYDFISEAEHRSFVIDPKTLKFTAEYSLDPNVLAAEEILMKGLGRREHGLQLANPNVDLTVELDKDTRVPIRLRGLTFPPIEQHDLRRRPRGPIQVRWAELRALAEELDAEDAREHRPSQFWVTRVGLIRLQQTTGQGLADTDVLNLHELKHLIGLPGAGKSTLIALLCILLARQKRRVAVFFTSIEVSREYLETLRRYEGVRVALLMGRSGQTHRRHSNRMAELIAGQGEGGFARTREGAELFAGSCPLPAFADQWPAKWQLGDAPCESLYEQGSEERKLCPAWSLCGRVKNQRELVHADVWLGHILSADTNVPAHTSEERLRYFELIADTFDLVIFDECDETQKVLDGHGALTLELTGNDQSVHIRIQNMTGLLAANRVKVSDGLLRYILQANEFERHMLRFVSEVRTLFANKRTHRLGVEYADKLLTASFLIREALLAAGSFDDFDHAAFSAISDFWERAMYRAFFSRSENETGWPKAEKYAPALGLDVRDANERWLRVNGALKRYLALDHAAAATEIVEEIAGDLAHLFHARSVNDIREQVRLLIAVGFTVASYQRLAKSARPLAQRGEIPDELVFSKASTEMRELVPRSILGTFSAVRYRRAAEIDGFQVDYLVMDSTPRLLMHRLHEVSRANVLLASATSWLEASTEYHVDKKPDYVLSPSSDQVGTVRLYALPKLHPSTKKPLRFSGGGPDREDNLRLMVRALAQPGAGDLSELQSAVASIRTELGKPRKAALVVNSYDQVRLVVEQINDVNPSLGERTRGVLRELPRGTLNYVLKGQVEELGQDPNVDVVVFPIAALGRGINIVFKSDDEDGGKAAVGSVYFLTRPHPAAGDLSLMVSLLAQRTQHLDHNVMAGLSLSEARQVYDVERYKTYKRISNLLARPMSASRLDDRTLRNFAANLLVPILQTIGRGMRKRMPVEVYFVDAAWAPNSAEGRPESERSSVLVLMRDVLEDCLAHADPDQRDVYHALYGVFLNAFRDVVNLRLPGEGERGRGGTNDLFNPSPAGAEDQFDDFDPDRLLETGEFTPDEDEDLFADVLGDTEEEEGDYA
ncbi:hypothetical protein DAERI_010060 [Deinococcus aerius]|uniref:pPIWI-RE three-gene island domain-containing protein n=1 Tax=Deinococcus aerius TaxID=200253 RepID=A0A2I9DD91_9DEIO|nr:hypothetical protein [Deinococcus aerius]GBF03888.1 hypothetical protein DAERI_010060 [Deinococcus aerius]